ncbi:MAG: hypothetical protein ACPHK6_09575, partial [Ilumatobacteraceae bacterium]
LTTGGGWLNYGSSSSAGVASRLYTKLAAGNDTRTFTTTTATDSAHIVLEVSGFDEGETFFNLVETAGNQSNGTAAPDSSLLNPTWPETLATGWLAFMGWNRASGETLNSYPSNFTQNQTVSAVTENVAVAMSTRFTEVTASLNPDAWALSAATGAHARTVAIRPAADGGANTNTPSTGNKSIMGSFGMGF